MLRLRFRILQRKIKISQAKIEKISNFANIRKISHNFIDSRAYRLQNLQNCLRLDHINDEKNQAKLEIFKEFINIFNLEGDKLSCTDTFMH